MRAVCAQQIRGDSGRSNLVTNFRPGATKNPEARPLSNRFPYSAGDTDWPGMAAFEIILMLQHDRNSDGLTVKSDQLSQHLRPTGSFLLFQAPFDLTNLIPILVWPSIPA